MSVCTTCEEAFGDGDIIAVCHICNDLFHAKKDCAGVTAAEIKVLESNCKNLGKKRKPMMLYRCNSCRENGNQPLSVSETLSKIQEKLNIVDELSASCNKHERDLKKLNGEVSKIKTNINDLNKIQLDFVSLKSDFRNLTDTVVKNSTVSTPSLTKTAVNTGNSLKMDDFEGAMKEFQDREKRKLNIMIYRLKESSDKEDFEKITELLAPFNLSSTLNPLNISRLGENPTHLLKL